MVSSSRQLRYLLWKNVILIRRNLAWTLFEFIVPLLICSVLIFVVRKMTKEGHQEHISTTRIEVSSKRFLGDCGQNVTLFYSVQNSSQKPLADELMKRFSAKEAWKRSRVFPNRIEYTTTDEIDRIIRNIEVIKDAHCRNYGILGGVVFNNIGPLIDYTIRILTLQETKAHGNWMEDYEYTPKSHWIGQIIDRRIPDYERNGVLSIQKLLDDSILEFHNITPPIANKFQEINTVQGYPFQPVIQDSVSLLVMLIVFPAVLNSAREMAHEKETDMKGFLAVHGVSSTVYYLSHIIIAWLKTFIAVLMSLTTVAVLIHTKMAWFVLILMAILYTTSIVAFATLATTIMKTAKGVTKLIILIWGISALLAKAAIHMKNIYWQMALCLNMNGAYASTLKALFDHEARGRPISLSALFEDPSYHFNTGMGILMMAIDVIIMLLLAMICEILSKKLKDRPLMDVFKKKKSFTGLSSYSMPKRMAAGVAAHKDHHISSFEEESSYHEKSEETEKLANIEIHNMYKIFSNGEYAVNGLDLKAYEGEVTVLLGHNGAGKSTTFNVLTGLLSPSSGLVHIGTRRIGLCQQTNSFFRSLTVEENLQLFHRLKGSKEEFVSEMEELLLALDMSDKRNIKAGKLSGGEKRKLCVAIALIGRSKVVLLDEPTAGMDPGARRDVEALIEEYKNNRTILLTTHYMDEAEMLGDRIVIMSLGKAIASGSIDYLKKKFGTGYVLSIVFCNECAHVEKRLPKIKQVVDDYIPNARAGEVHGRQVDIILPRDHKDTFGDLFEKLEDNQADLHIDSFGLSLNSLEQVFLKVIEMTSESDSTEEDAKAELLRVIGKDENFRTGCGLILMQFLALFYKSFLLHFHNLANTVERIVLPIVIMLLFLCNSTPPDSMDSERREISLNKLGPLIFLSKFKDYANAEVFASLLKNSKDIQHKSVTGDFEKYINDHPKTFPAVAMGFEAMKDNVTLYYHSNAIHIMPTMQNLVSNLQLAKRNITIKTAVEFVGPSKMVPVLGERETFNIYLSVLLAVCLSFVVSGAMHSLVHERVTRFRHQQLLTPLSSYIFWIHQCIFDTIVYTVVTGCFFIFWFGFDTFTDKLDNMILIIWAIHLGMVPFMYFTSHFYSSPVKANISTMIILVVISAVVCFALFCLDGAALVVEMTDMQKQQRTYSANPLILPHNSKGFLFVVKEIAYILFPMSSLMDAALINTRSLYKAQFIHFAAFRENPKEYAWEPQNPLIRDRASFESDYGFVLNLQTVLVFSAVMILLFLLSRLRCLRKRLSLLAAGMTCRKKNKADCDENDVEQDDDVLQEIEMVDHFSEGMVVKVDDLTKQYGGYKAVKGISFGVKSNECFGLLGQNGAGKTSTFDIMTGVQFANSGTVRLNGMKSPKLGYCPQFDALLPEMTGRETLRFLSMLNGYIGIKEKAESMLTAVGLEKHGNKLISQYSGGQRRKLSIAVAVLTRSNIIVLDEPTAGIDPKARRDIWTLLSLTREHRGCAIILTSHSMDECEALCTRIGILQKGRLIALGASQHLKSKFGNNYSATILLPDSFQFEVVHSVMEKVFPGIQLKPSRSLTNLKWTIPRSPDSKWSDIWFKVQKIAERYHAKDYCVTQSTLEETFLKLSERPEKLPSENK